MKVHEFTSTSEAYDRSQGDPRIRFGDILVVKSECVVGFLRSAWPVAVTKSAGHFHKKRSDFSWERLCEPLWYENGHPDYILSYKKTQKIALELGFELSK